MDFDVMTAISNVGFPIACCLFMIYNNNKSVKENNETIKEMSKLISENTAVMKDLSNLITHFITGASKNE